MATSSTRIALMGAEATVWDQQFPSLTFHWASMTQPLCLENDISLLLQVGQAVGVERMAKTKAKGAAGKTKDCTQRQEEWVMDREDSGCP